MAEFTAKDVQALRQATGAGMMDAKRALTENEGDFEKATIWLREKGLADVGKRSGRENTQGAVAVAIEGNAAAVVELKCETDFVAKAADFVNLVADLAQLVAGKGDAAVAERAADIAALGTTLKENIELGRIVRYEAGDGSVLDTYLHVQNDRGVIGVLVELAGGSQELAHDVALHIASAAPDYLRREDVPAEVVEAERQVQENKTINEGKPAQAVAKIVEGRMGGFFKEICLLEQPFVKEPKQSVKDYLGSAEVVRFARIKVGA